MEGKVVLAIDPGNIESAYVLIDAKTYKPLDFGKVENSHLRDYFKRYIDADDVCIEMIASYGMAVGASVFDTCVWIGRFSELFYGLRGVEPDRVFRKDVKMNLCGSTRARDANITQALADRFAYDRHKDRNSGKGTKKDPGFFYGFKKDVWAAYAVGVTYLDKYYAEGERF